MTTVLILSPGRGRGMICFIPLSVAKMATNTALTSIPSVPPSPAFLHTQPRWSPESPSPACEHCRTPTGTRDRMSGKDVFSLHQHLLTPYSFPASSLSHTPLSSVSSITSFPSVSRLTKDAQRRECPLALLGDIQVSTFNRYSFGQNRVRNKHPQGKHGYMWSVVYPVRSYLGGVSQMWS